MDEDEMDDNEPGEDREWLDSSKYRMEFKCFNCGKIFTRFLKKGTTADGQGGECPICGVDDNNPKNYQQRRHTPIR